MTIPQLLASVQARINYALHVISKKKPKFLARVPTLYLVIGIAAVIVVVIAVLVSKTLTLAVALSCLSVCISLAAFSVASFNVFVSRFPQVHLRTNCFTTMDHEVTPPKHERIFEVEVESWGLPIWDMYVKFRVDYLRGQSNYSEVSIVLKPVGTRPNPVAPGQVVKFMVSQEAFYKAAEPFQLKRTHGLADLPPEQVWLCVYGSGGRLVKKINTKDFNYHFFSSFDKLRKNNEDKVEPLAENGFPFGGSVNINPYNWLG